MRRSSPAAWSTIPSRPASRALVLGGGGTTGIAWEAGILDTLADSGVDAGRADLIVGTSAGAVVGAFLALGVTPHQFATDMVHRMQTLGRINIRMLTRLAAGRVGRTRVGRTRRYGRISSVTSGLKPDAFVEAISADLIGRPWPDQLVVTTINARTGLPATYDADSGVDLGLAVAASCAVPGIFPAITIDGDPHLDGGVVSHANVPVAAGSHRLLVLSPLHRARDPRRRPREQLADLPPDARWLLIRPDATARRAIGFQVLDASRTVLARAAGRRQGREAAPTASRIWA